MLLHKVFNSHDPFFSNYESSTVVSHLELTDNYSTPSFSLSDMRENASIVASLLTRSRDPSPLLRHPSVYSCCWQQTRRGDASRCATRHGSARLGSARPGQSSEVEPIILVACTNHTRHNNNNNNKKKKKKKKKKKFH
jgi:hypothetical protein